MGETPVWKWIVAGANPLAAIPGISPYYDSGESDEGSGESSDPNGLSPSTPDVGNVSDVGSLEQQAAQRRLARMSKYFTTPTGVLDTPTGSSGVF